jgi:hypothetical protein
MTPWLFSRRADLWTFVGSAAVAMGLLAIGWPLGWLDGKSPEWTWIVAILLIDVAHVYATGFRVYFDRVELARRPWLYGLTPLASFAVGWAIYSESESLFWSGLAYLAVFHFVRQQYGWVALYRSRGKETDSLGKWIDTSAIYLSMLYPLVYWHSHLPREFWWFRQGDFIPVSFDLAERLFPVYVVSLGVYAARVLYRMARDGWVNPGKDAVVATTAICWYVGIVAFNSDFAFMVTNVIIHGIPYLVLVYWYRFRWVQTNDSDHVRSDANPTRSWWVLFLGIIWMLAYAEELLWDASLWHERPWLFGVWPGLDSWRGILVPLLVVPQVTHYVLDGFIWKRRTNAVFAKFVEDVA